MSITVPNVGHLGLSNSVLLAQQNVTVLDILQAKVAMALL